MRIGELNSVLCDNLEAWEGVQEGGDMCVPVGDSGGGDLHVADSY